MEQHATTISKIINLHIGDSDSVALCFSGGSDSVFLYHLLKQIKVKFVPIVVNHNLRPNMNLEIQQLLNDYPDLQVIEWDHDGISKNIEGQAREFRYQAIANKCKQLGVSCALLAHHKNDQAETLLLNLMRGSNIDGLSAMPTCVNKHGINFIRPMLNITKNEIVTACQSNKWPWIEDETNKEHNFKRNHLRYLLEQVIDSKLLTDRLCSTASAMQKQKLQSDYLLAEHIANNAITSTAEIKYPMSKMRTIPKPLAISLLYNFIATTSTTNKPKPRLQKINNIYNAFMLESEGKRELQDIAIIWNDNYVVIKAATI